MNFFIQKEGEEILLFQAARRKLSLVIVIALLISSLTPHLVFGESAQLKDIAGSYAQKEIQSLTEAGIISGYEDNTFKPNKAMSRAELAKIIVLSLGLEVSGDQAVAFKDVAATSWYRGCRCVGEGRHHRGDIGEHVQS
ncbi:S-layer homology domain-containing protein [Paenibacillus silagei]|uniref:SLH domain-containing protein n=1 Tax=Paenibacillus silagei TaxID=1670801 RepID=A0ABS4NV76_9BACL|nr:S-layer homology domain-containing protein [Paenibacillus silagei]MBP2113948.1 hypothetical protein [Paenibacillus silagei]